MQDRALGQHRRRVFRIDVVVHPVEAELVDVAQDLRRAVRVDRLHLHRFAAQVHVGLEILETRVLAQKVERLCRRRAVGRDVDARAEVLGRAEELEIRPVLRHFALRIEIDGQLRMVADLLPDGVQVQLPPDADGRPSG